MLRAQVQSLIRELRSCKPWNVAKNKNSHLKKMEIEVPIFKWQLKQLKIKSQAFISHPLSFCFDSALQMFHGPWAYHHSSVPGTSAGKAQRSPCEFTGLRRRQEEFLYQIWPFPQKPLCGLSIKYPCGQCYMRPSQDQQNVCLIIQCCPEEWGSSPFYHPPKFWQGNMLTFPPSESLERGGAETRLI